MKKQFYKFSALILAVVCGAAALSACGAKPAENTQTTAAAVTEATTDAATDAATEAVQTTEEPTRAADEFVRTVRVESWETKYGDETREYFCQQPELLIQSADADAINAEIAERCNKIFDAYDSGKPMEDFSKGAEYKAYLNGKTLSLVFIDRAPVNQSVYYYVYNIDVESGSRLDDAELIARSGNDADTAHAQLAERVAEYFDAKTAGMQGGMDTVIAKCREKTLSDEYLGKAQYYLADRNTLSAVFAYNWVAGAEQYLDTTEVFPHLPQY